MTLTDNHIATMKEAPFVIGRFPGLTHELARKGLMRWSEGAWRLTHAGQEVLSTMETGAAA